MLFLVWGIGLFVVPLLVKKLETGYGIATIGALVIWSAACAIYGMFF